MDLTLIGCLLLAGVTLGIVLALFWRRPFPTWPFRYWESLEGYAGTKDVDIGQIVREIEKSLVERSRIYSQHLAAVFVAFVIALLLILNVVSADAGLPILTAVIAFVLGRGESSVSDNLKPPSEPGPRGE